MAFMALACKKVLGLSGEPVPYDSVFVESGARPDVDAEPPTELPGDAACGANRVTDPRNCGSCGHDCLGAPCQAGRCVPQLVVRTSDVRGAFAVRDGLVYTSERDTIFRAEAGGARVTIAASGVGSTPNAFATDDRRIVWSTDSDGLRGCPIGGCPGAPTQISAPAKLVRGVGRLPGSATAWPFVWVGETSLQTYAASGPVTLGQASIGEAQCTGFAANDTYAFFAEMAASKLLTIRPLGTSAVVSKTLPANYPCAVATRKNRLFWSDLNSIWRATVDADGNVKDPIALANEPSMAGTMAADDDHVYWANTSTEEPAIHRCGVDGCQGKPETFVAGTPRIPQIAVDGAYLYFSVALNVTAGTEIFRVAR